MTTRRKPKILIIGHARHGKDMFAQLLSEECGFHFSSSSEFVANEFIWPFWGHSRYESFTEFFEDRGNNRKLWADMITAYNTPNKCKTAETMFEQGNDMYVGMRRRDELEACNAKSLFDLVIWVEASKRKPLEPSSSMELKAGDADYVVDNNEDSKNLRADGVNMDLLPEAGRIRHLLHGMGFDVGLPDEEQVSMKEPAMVLDPMPPLMSEGTEISVLDHGFVTLRRVDGTDQDIVDAARISYGEGTKTVSDNEKLIRYLMKNYHTSPLEMVGMQFQIRMPIFVMRQWVRHRTANLNEYSGRYSVMPEIYYTPEVGDIRKQGKTNKQGSGDALHPTITSKAQDIMGTVSQHSFDEYNRLLEMGVSRETARIILPLNAYTDIVWRLDISNMIKFLRLRDDPHSQWEIQEYARVVSSFLCEHFPMVHKVYEEMKQMVSLSPEQIEALLAGSAARLTSQSEAAVVSNLLDKYKAQL